MNFLRNVFKKFIAPVITAIAPGLKPVVNVVSRVIDQVLGGGGGGGQNNNPNPGGPPSGTGAPAGRPNPRQTNAAAGNEQRRDIAATPKGGPGSKDTMPVTPLRPAHRTKSIQMTPEQLAFINSPEGKRIMEMVARMPELVGAAVSVSKTYKEAFDYLLANGINMEEEQIRAIVEPALKKMWDSKYSVQLRPASRPASSLRLQELADQKRYEEFLRRDEANRRFNPHYASFQSGLTPSQQAKYEKIIEDQRRENAERRFNPHHAQFQGRGLTHNERARYEQIVLQQIVEQGGPEDEQERNIWENASEESKNHALANEAEKRFNPNHPEYKQRVMSASQEKIYQDIVQRDRMNKLVVIAKLNGPPTKEQSELWNSATQAERAQALARAKPAVTAIPVPKPRYAGAQVSLGTGQDQLQGGISVNVNIRSGQDVQSALTDAINRQIAAAVVSVAGNAIGSAGYGIREVSSNVSKEITKEVFRRAMPAIPREVIDNAVEQEWGAVEGRAEQFAANVSTVGVDLPKVVVEHISHETAERIASTITDQVTRFKSDPVAWWNKTRVDLALAYHELQKQTEEAQKRVRYPFGTPEEILNKAASWIGGMRSDLWIGTVGTVTHAGNRSGVYTAVDAALYIPNLILTYARGATGDKTSYKPLTIFGEVVYGPGGVPLPAWDEVRAWHGQQLPDYSQTQAWKDVQPFTELIVDTINVIPWGWQAVGSFAKSTAGKGFKAFDDFMTPIGRWATQYVDIHAVGSGPGLVLRRRFGNIEDQAKHLVNFNRSIWDYLKDTRPSHWRDYPPVVVASTYVDNSTISLTYNGDLFTRHVDEHGPAYAQKIEEIVGKFNRNSRELRLFLPQKDRTWHPGVAAQGLPFEGPKLYIPDHAETDLIHISMLHPSINKVPDFVAISHIDGPCLACINYFTDSWINSQLPTVPIYYPLLDEKNKHIIDYGVWPWDWNR